jgi:nickel-dependent lactate racemase
VSKEDGVPAGDSLKLNYGRGHLRLDLSGFLKVKVFCAQEGRAIEDLRAGVLDAIRNPIDSPSLAEAAGSAKKVVICVPDRTRPRVAPGILPVMLDELLRAGIGLQQVSIFVASGTHGEHSQQELRDVVGEEIPAGISVHQNRCLVSEDFENLGTTSRGTPVLINRRVMEADLAILIGTVAYHYFAGWGGGRKMLIPGAAHFETACANHRLNIDKGGNLCPACRNAVLEGNPVHEDMVEAASMVRNAFMVNIILDGWARVAGITAGHVIGSHLRAVEKAKDLLEVPVGERCDLAIASAGGHPFDIDLVQAHKSIDHAAHCLKDGGVIIALAECPNGLGSDDLMTWFDLGGARAISRRLMWQYGIHGHTALSIAMKLERMRIILLSSLDSATVKRTGMIPARDMEEAVSVARSQMGGDGLTYVFPCSWGILPVAGS